MLRTVCAAAFLIHKAFVQQQGGADVTLWLHVLKKKKKKVETKGPICCAGRPLDEQSSAGSNVLQIFSMDEEQREGGGRFFGGKQPMSANKRKECKVR